MPVPDPKKKLPKRPRGNGIVKPDPAAKQAVRRAPRKKNEVVPPRLAFQEVRIGSRSYPLVTDPGCLVCRHPKRALIEEQILLGTTFAAIARWITDRDHETPDGRAQQWPAVSVQQLSRHFEEDHSPLDAAVVRDLQRQEVDTAEYENVGTRLVNGLVFAGKIIDDVNQAVVRGELRPTIKDGIAAARLKVAAEQAKALADEAEAHNDSWFYEQAFDVFFDKAKAIMSADQHKQFLDELRSDATLRALYERRQNPSAQMEKTA